MVCVPIHKSSFHNCPVLWRKDKREEELVCVALHKRLVSRLPYTLLCSIIFKEKFFVGISIGKMQVVKVMKSHSIQGKRRIKEEYKVSYTWEYNIWKICDSFFLAAGEKIWIHHTTFICYILYMYMSVCCFWLSFL